MQPLSDAELALLSLLAEQSRHGWEIEALIENRGLREWTEIGFSSIYFLLDKLEGRGFAVSAKAGASAKARRVFSITPEGRAELANATLRRLEAPNRLYPQVLLGLANWPGVEAAEGLAALDRRAAALASEIARISAKREAQRPLPDFVEALFDHSLSLLRADLEWSARARRSLEGDMQKIDFRKSEPKLYTAPTDRFVEIDVPEMAFVRVDGEGDPNTSPVYAHALQWLYAVSYALKFAAKSSGLDYVVPPLEGLWPDGPAALSKSKADWSWTMLIRAPDIVGADMFATAVAKSEKTLGPRPTTLRLERRVEGRCLQILHVGAYDDEAPTLQRLHSQEMPARSLDFAGPHHEIYLSDPRKTAPEKLKTLLRQPVKPRG